MAGVHPLLRLAVEQPQLLAEHLAAYLDAIAQEGGVVAARLRRQLVWQCVAGAGLLLGLGLAGVALMLWALLPLPSPAAGWVLLGVPALPALLGLWALMLARSDSDSSLPAFAALRRHAQADLALLRGVCDAP